MSASIEQLDHCLASKRPTYYALLQPGATEAQLDAFDARFSLTLPTTFRELYRWKNGRVASSSLPLHRNRTFSTLEEVTSTKELLDEMIGYDFEDPKWWRRGWVPFLHNGGGSHLCLDLTAEDGGQSGQLIAFWKADKDRPIEHPSLEAWLGKLVAAMEKLSPEVV